MGSHVSDIACALYRISLVTHIRVSWLCIYCITESIWNLPFAVAVLEFSPGLFVSMSIKLSFVTVDVFTDVRFAGNPLAIVNVPKNITLTQDQKQKVAREFNLSETVFLHEDLGGLESRRADIFITTAEIPFGGTVSCFICASGHTNPSIYFEAYMNRPSHHWYPLLHGLTAPQRLTPASLTYKGRAYPLQLRLHRHSHCLRQYSAQCAHPFQTNFPRGAYRQPIISCYLPR